MLLLPVGKGVLWGCLGDSLQDEKICKSAIAVVTAHEDGTD